MKNLQKHKTIPKSTRLEVWNKYNHHCAYCGKELEYKDMQVDHLIPQKYLQLKSKQHMWDKIETFDNYMPACRCCNHYKRAHSLETFRRYIEEIPLKLGNNYIYKVGIQYGFMPNPCKQSVEFYFEKQ